MAGFIVETCRGYGVPGRRVRPPGAAAHVPDITQLSGAEAATLGKVLARVTAALKIATNAELIYVTVFGERIDHVHFNLAPHRGGDPLTGGAGMLIPGTSDRPAEEHTTVVKAIRASVQPAP